MCNNFLENKKHENTIQELLAFYKALNSNMSLKIYFLGPHLNFFPENLGGVLDEHGERFHKDMMHIEKRYNEKWSEAIIGDFWVDLSGNSNEKYTKKEKYK